MTIELQQRREKNFGRQLLQLERKFTQQSLLLMTARGLIDINLGHFSVLPFIDDIGVRATTVAKQSGISKQAVGKSIDDLKAKGYITSINDPDDKRATLIKFSPLGLKMMDIALQATQEVELKWQDLIGHSKFSQLKLSCTELLMKLN
jgi:DNA-binding MarR family transcriptional regulator